jgi:hypothetical protein
MVTDRPTWAYRTCPILLDGAANGVEVEKVCKACCTPLFAVPCLHDPHPGADHARHAAHGAKQLGNGMDMPILA